MISRGIKFITGFMLLCAIQYLCNSIVNKCHIILPSPILGLIVFAFLLQLNVIKKEWVQDACEFMLKIMPMLFVPLLAGIIVYYSVIEKNLIPILVNIIITATFTLLLTGIIVDNIIKYVRLKKMKEKHNE